jgi:hypothetical protein
MTLVPAEPATPTSEADLHPAHLHPQKRHHDKHWELDVRRDSEEQPPGHEAVGRAAAMVRHVETHY